MYDRTKDWADIEAMLEVNSIDKSRVIGWLVRLLGVDDPRTRKFISYEFHAPDHARDEPFRGIAPTTNFGLHR